MCKFNILHIKSASRCNHVFKNLCSCNVQILKYCTSYLHKQAQISKDNGNFINFTEVEEAAFSQVRVSDIKVEELQPSCQYVLMVQLPD